MKQEYIYAVTRIHGQEKSLLNAQDMERLLSTQNAEACFTLLFEKGWGTPDMHTGDFDALMSIEREKTYAIVRELLGDLSPLSVLFCENDYHNLKAAVKLVYTGQDKEDTKKYFLTPSAVSPELMLQAARQRNFSELPPDLAQAGSDAFDVLAQTSSGQACDMVMDYAALMAIHAQGQKSSVPLLRQYALLKVDTANIKSAVRACHMGKGRDFLERAIVPAGSLDRKALILSAEKSFEEICTFLCNTAYAQAVDALRESLTAFESWCDSRLMQSIRPQKNEYFSIEPLAAYILARENEIAMVRLILSAKLNRLGDAVVRGRWRQMYV